MTSYIDAIDLVPGTKYNIELFVPDINNNFSRHKKQATFLYNNATIYDNIESFFDPDDAIEKPSNEKRNIPYSLLHFSWRYSPTIVSAVRDRVEAGINGLPPMSYLLQVQNEIANTAFHVGQYEPTVIELFNQFKKLETHQKQNQQNQQNNTFNSCP